MMKACGHTMFMISWSTYSDAADVLMLKPARFSSSAMVAVPPEEDALVAAPLAVGVTATTDTLSAPAARAAKADRFNNPFSRIALPCLPAAPVTGRLYPAHPSYSRRKTFVNVTQLPHSLGSWRREFLQERAEE